MISRLKLPAYGKRLIEARRAGDHPLVVHFIYGERWKEEPLCVWQCAGGAHAKLCLTPAGYQPGAYDFHLVAGLQVALFDQAGASLAPEDRIFDLIGEIARFSADLHVHVPGDEWPAAADMLAYCQRDYGRYRDAAANHGWPRWWSNEIERLNEQRRQAWLETALAAPEEV